MGIAIGACVQFNHLGSDSVCGFDLAPVRRDEDRNARTGLAQWRNEMRQAILVLRHFQAPFGRAFLPLFRNDAHGVRPVAQCNGLHLFRGRHLEIQRHAKRLRQLFDVMIGYVASVFAEMRGYPVRTGLLGKLRRPNRVRIVAAARIANGGHVVDVHSEPEVFHAGTLGCEPEPVHCLSDDGLQGIVGRFSATAPSHVRQRIRLVPVARQLVPGQPQRTGDNAPDIRPLAIRIARNQPAAEVDIDLVKRASRIVEFVDHHDRADLHGQASFLVDFPDEVFRK